MRIYDALQGHLAQLVGRELHTLPRGKKFKVLRVIPVKNSQVEWKIDLSVGNKGNISSVYLTDLLWAYAWLVSRPWDSWILQRNLKEYFDSDFKSKKIANDLATSYMMAILATFDDIEKREGNAAAIKFVPKSATYKD